jgi:hypothetical protein
MVGERGFEPPTPWSRTNNRFINLLSRLGLFCVFHPVSSRYSAANGPKLDPTFPHSLMTLFASFSVCGAPGWRPSSQRVLTVAKLDKL